MANEKNNAWELLIEKYVANTISKEELTELLQMMGDEKDMESLSSSLKMYWEKAKEKSAIAETNWDEKFVAMMNDLKKTAPVIKLNPLKKTKWIYRIAIAASVLIVLSGSAHFFFFNNTVNEVSQTNSNQIKNDITAPTGTKTTLTLGNGSTIILDSVRNGMLAQQGNSKVQKLNNNQIAYNISDEKTTSIVFNTLSTAKGGQTMVVLADGTKVWLNALSTLKFPTAFAGKTREVELTGEGYFEVAKNAKMPFHVKANDVEVEVLGTHFNVMAYSDEENMKTTLFEGSVKIKGRETKILKPGEQAIVNPTIGNVQVKTDVDTDETLAWKNGFFEFSRTDMKSILRQVSRWYDVTVRYNDNVNTSRTFSAIVSRSSNLSAVMKIMENANIHFRLEGKKMIITE